MDYNAPRPPLGQPHQMPQFYPPENDKSGNPSYQNFPGQFQPYPKPPLFQPTAFNGPSTPSTSSGASGTPMLRSLVENGFGSSPTNSQSQAPPSVPPDPLQKILDVNATLILQINQAILENRQEVIQESLPLLTKNLSYLNSLAEQPPNDGSAASPKISHSPIPLRPSSQNTPPQASPPPMSQNVQNGPYGGAQNRPSAPVYSPLSQSTHMKAPPNVAPFQQPGPPNGFNRPMGVPQPQYGSQMSMSGGMTQPVSSGTMMPPPQQPGYSYSGPPQGPYGHGYNPSQEPLEQQGDPGYTSMPPPQGQPPRRTSNVTYRPGVPGPAQDPRQMQQMPAQSQQPPMQFARSYSDPYSTQPPTPGYPGMPPMAPQQQQQPQPGYHNIQPGMPSTAQFPGMNSQQSSGYAPQSQPQYSTPMDGSNVQMGYPPNQMLGGPPQQQQYFYRNPGSNYPPQGPGS